MKNLAELTFEYIWLLMFADSDLIDKGYSSEMQASLPDVFRLMSESEKQALSEVAKQAQMNLLAQSSKSGVETESLLPTEQEAFLEVLSTGELYRQWA